MRLPAWILGSAVAGLLAAPALRAFAAPAPSPALAPDLKAIEFFETKVRPLLAEHCFACHSGTNPQGGLNLRDRAPLLKGGALGPSVIPGDPDRSLLVQAVRYNGHLKMPPKGKLPADQVAALAEWVKLGAPWPEINSKVQGQKAKEGTGSTPRSALRAPSPLKHWAFQPVKRPAVPRVKDAAWVKNPIDAFILQKLEAKGLKPAPAADRRTLIRRATFDLTGLPPTPEEVEAFVADRSPDAWENVVDRLLASPHYGERWGRHWLDVVRYADSNGLDENTAFGNAWRYRDYVVRSLNVDKPYDQFIREQLAGDLIAERNGQEIGNWRLETGTTSRQGRSPTPREDLLIATGFLSLGPKVLAEPDKQKMVMDIVDEQIDTVGKTFMGLTLGCARCHDHKFDPLPTKDYYALAGIFKSTRTMATLNTVARVLERPLGDAEAAAARAAHETEVKNLYNRINKVKDEAQKRRLEEELKALKERGPAEVPMAIAVQDETEMGSVRVHIRGNHLTLGEEAPRGFPGVLALANQPAIPPKQSGRLELATWITRPDHPLTGRVIVNRVWQGHFGEGLVRTPDNFGTLGERPSHPELLDYLAATFVKGVECSVFGVREGTSSPNTSGPNTQHPTPDTSPRPWSLKALHRLIMLSNAYRMSVRFAPAPYAKDPENRLLWRMNRRRLEVEAIRDSMLAIGGTLDRTLGGSLLATPNFAYVTNDQSKNAAQYDAPRRSIYLPVIRNAVYDAFQVFDFVEPSLPNGKRASTTVAPQALFLLNSDLVLRQSRALAEQLLTLPTASDAERLRLAYQKAYARPASDVETADALDYLRRYEADLERVEGQPTKRRLLAWQSYCQLLFAASEFIYVN